MYKRELHLFKPAASEPNVLLIRLSGDFPPESLLQNVGEMMGLPSYLSEKLSQTLKPFEDTQSGFSFQRNITESNERRMTLEIHAFGLDDMIHHKILVSTYLFTEQNFNTSTLF